MQTHFCWFSGWIPQFQTPTYYISNIPIFQYSTYSLNFQLLTSNSNFLLKLFDWLFVLIVWFWLYDFDCMSLIFWFNSSVFQPSKSSNFWLFDWLFDFQIFQIFRFSWFDFDCLIWLSSFLIAGVFQYHP